MGMAHDMRTSIARMKLRLDALLVDVLGIKEYPYEDLEACHEDLEVLLSLFNGMVVIWC